MSRCQPWSPGIFRVSNTRYCSPQGMASTFPHESLGRQDAGPVRICGGESLEAEESAVNQSASPSAQLSQVKPSKPACNQEVGLWAVGMAAVLAAHEPVKHKHSCLGAILAVPLHTPLCEHDWLQRLLINTRKVFPCPPSLTISSGAPSWFDTE